MNAVKSYALWYSGDGMHRVLNAAKQESAIFTTYLAMAPLRVSKWQKECWIILSSTRDN